jgi:hypothetical protein
MVHYALADEIVEAIDLLTAEQDAKPIDSELAVDDAPPDAGRSSVAPAAA